MSGTRDPDTSVRMLKVKAVQLEKGLQKFIAFENVAKRQIIFFTKIMATKELNRATG